MSIRQKTLSGNPNLAQTDFNAPPQDPLILLKEWLQGAEQCEVSEPCGLVLSTVDSQNQPSSRVVLMIDCDDTGVIFGTSETSNKAKEFKENPQVAGTLWWRETVQQINFKGSVTRLSKPRSEAFFAERPREGQAVSAVVHPSSPLLDKADLHAQVLAQFNQVGAIPCPPEWYAFHIAIHAIEFWQGSPDRFHKRLRYDLVDQKWNHTRLQP